MLALFRSLLWKVFLAGAVLSLFLYRLNDTALTSYDEAWYASITRTVAQTGNLFRLQFNGATFTDHPPLGFWLMAVPTALFGSSELSARLIPALAGFGCVLLMYVVGKVLKNTATGITAGALLCSSLWFLYRARSGNLDTIFLFFLLLTLYCLLRTNRHVRWWYGATLSFVCLFLTKTLVGAGILPVFGLILWMQRKTLRLDVLLKMAVLAVAGIAPWYVYNASLDPHFLAYHFLTIGARQESGTFALSALTQSLDYLRYGIGKWFRLVLLSIPLGAVLFARNHAFQKPFLILTFTTMGFLPFFFSSQVQIWHLLPVYPPVLLFCALVLIDIAERFSLLFRWSVPLAVAGVLTLAGLQLRDMSGLLYTRTPQASAERSIAQDAGEFAHIFLDDPAYPAVVYYSQTKVTPLSTHPEAYQVITTVLQAKGDPVLTRTGRLRELDRDGISYTILHQRDDFVLIR